MSNLTAEIIAGVKTYHARPGDIQNEEIRTALTATLADITSIDSDVSSVEVDITAADIVAMYTTPVEVVAAVADSAIEFVSAVLIYDYDTAAYTGGGVVTVNFAGGVAQSSNIAAANSFAASGDKVYSMNALNAAGGRSLLVNTGLVITNATGAFVNPGTAAGVGRLIITYRVHTTNL